MIYQSFAGYLEDAFESSTSESAPDFQFATGQGDLLLTFTEWGRMSMHDEGFEVDMEIGDLASLTFLIGAEVKPAMPPTVRSSPSGTRPMSPSQQGLGRCSACRRLVPLLN